MKKLLKVWLILVVFCAFFNVKAVEKDNTTTTDQEEKEEEDDFPVDIKVNGVVVICNENLTCDYTITDNSLTKVSIEYGSILTEMKKVDKTIQDGENKFTFDIKTPDGKTLKYTLNITKVALSTDSSLKKLTINGAEITLKNGTNQYSTTVSYSTNKLEVEAIPNSDKAKVDGANKNKVYYDLFENTKSIQIKVIAESGDVTTYVVEVKKREEADATLKSLKIKGVTIDFESKTYDYTLSVLKSVEKLEIDAVPTDSKANITIKGNEKELSMGENTITIEVENDGNIKTYTLKVNRLDMEDDSVANLKSLKIKGYDLNFKETKYEYDLEIGDVNYLDIDYETLNPDAKVEVTGNVDLVNGSIIKIKVTYGDEITNIYRINIIKEEVEEKQSNSFIVVIIIVVILLIILGVIITMLILKKKNQNKPKQKVSKKETEVKNENITPIGVNPNVNPSDVVALDDDREIEDII